MLKRLRLSVSQLCEQLEIDPAKFRSIELAFDDFHRTHEVRIVIEEPDEHILRVSTTQQR
jgi:hypothetical protein